MYQQEVNMYFQTNNRQYNTVLTELLSFILTVGSCSSDNNTGCNVPHSSGYSSPNCTANNDTSRSSSCLSCPLTFFKPRVMESIIVSILMTS